MTSLFAHLFALYSSMQDPSIPLFSSISHLSYRTPPYIPLDLSCFGLFPIVDSPHTCISLFGLNLHPLDSSVFDLVSPIMHILSSISLSLSYLLICFSSSTLIAHAYNLDHHSLTCCFRICTLLLFTSTCFLPQRYHPSIIHCFIFLCNLIRSSSHTIFFSPCPHRYLLLHLFYYSIYLHGSCIFDLHRYLCCFLHHRPFKPLLLPAVYHIVFFRGCVASE